MKLDSHRSARRHSGIWERSETMRRASLLPAYLAAGVAGLAYVAGNVGGLAWPIALVCFVPLHWAIAEARERSLWHSAGLGAAMGGALYVSGFDWLLVLADDFIGAPVGISYAMWLAYGLLIVTGFALAAMLQGMLQRRATYASVWAMILPWLLLEWWQPALFPVHLGAGLVEAPYVVDIADLGGPLLLSGWLLFLNALCYRFISARVFPPVARWSATRVVCSGLIVVLPLLYGLYRQSALVDALPSDTLRVAAIQANISQTDGLRYERDSHAQHLAMSREAISNHDVDLLIWPESAYPRGVRLPLPLDAQSIRKDIHVPLMLGGTAIEEKSGQRVSANAVFMINASGMLEQSYHKQLLIPFAETIPFEVLTHKLGDWVRRTFPHHQNFQQGQGHQAFALNDLRIVTPICFEIIHPAFVRDMVVRTDPDVIVTLANDAWFGDTNAPRMHLALAQMRAIETRKWVVRVTSTGVSAVINPQGKRVAETGFGTQEVLYAMLPVYSAHSFYMRWGDWPGWVALACLVFHGWPRRRRSLQVSAQPIKPV